jgi:hypothetical protein
MENGIKDFEFPSAYKHAKRPQNEVGVLHV